MLFVGILIAVGAGLSLVVMALLPDLDDDWTLIRTAGARTARYALTASLLFAGVAVVTTSTTWTTFAALPTIVAVAAYAIAGGVDAVGVPTNQVVGRRLPMEGPTGAMAIGMRAGYGAQSCCRGRSPWLRRCRCGSCGPMSTADARSSGRRDACAAWSRRRRPWWCG